MGSGPSCYVGAYRNPGAQVLISPFTSVRGAVESIGGSIAKFFVKERFKNIELINKVKCPTLFIHGRLDNLIPYKHSQKLFSNLFI